MEISSPAVSAFANFANSVLSPYLGAPISLPLAILIGIVVFFIIISVIFSISSYVLGWVERKFIARTQSRHGPTYVGKWGFLQNLADLIKLVSKEWINLDMADKPIFYFVLPFIVASMLVLFTMIPLSPTLIGVNSTLGLFAIFVVVSFYPLLLFLAGWASGNKFASISAQRSIIMMVSYELPMFIVIAAVAAISGGFSMLGVVGGQAGLWNMVRMPIGFVIFFIVMLAELERPPFDLREADSELIAGWLTDYNSPMYAITLLLDYTRLCFGSLLITVLFLGGWLGPSILPPFAWTMIKLVVVSLVIMLVRVTTVRMRIDKVIKSGWIYLIPLSLLNLLITFILFVK